MDNKKVVYTIQKKKMLPSEYVDIYKKAESNEVNYAWKTAAIMYATKNHASFADAFGSIDEYAKAIGVNKSTISRKIRAVQVRIDLFNEYGDKYIPLTLEQVIELLPLLKYDFIADFMDIHGNKILNENRDGIRDMVKEYIEEHTVSDEVVGNTTDEVVGNTTDEVVGNTTDEVVGNTTDEVVGDNVYIGFCIGGENYDLRITDSKQIETVLNLIKSMGLLLNGKKKEE